MDNKTNILGQEVESDNSYSDSIKDAIIACAREEVRNILRDITSPHGSVSLNSINQCADFSDTRRPKSASKNGQLRKIKSAQLRRRKQSYQCHPLSSYESCRDLSAMTSNAYDSKRKKHLSKEKCIENRIQLSSIDGIGQNKILSDKETKEMSFASSKWIRRSASLIMRDGEDQKEMRLSNLAEKDNDYKNALSMETNDATTKFLPKEKNMKGKRKLVKQRPQTATGLVRRPLHGQTTALERRISSSRPSTAHMVRAKAEDFSKSLLHPIQNHESNFSSNISRSLPNVLDENEWENELARHIVSVFNNKIVSEVRNREGDASKAKERILKDTRGDVLPLSGNIISVVQDAERVDPIHPSNRIEGASFYKKKGNPFKESKKLMDNVKPRMVWITGTGNFPSDWRILESFTTFENGANETLTKLASQGKYRKYIEIVKASLCASPLNESTTSSADTKSARTRESLWRQLILIVNSFVIKLIQQRKYPLAIDLLDTAKNLLLYLDVKTCKNTIDELSGFIKNSFAYYYSKRDKPSAALQYIIEATTIQRRRKDTLNIVRCNLYRSFILQQLNRYCEAMKLLKVVLKMVDDGSLDSLYKSSMSASSNGNNKNMFLEANDNDPQIVLLVAVTYHNLCCLQLIKGQIGDACMNSQNCRKLCRLCMNISNRYVIHFEETHMKAMNELFGIICPKQTEKEAIVFQRMFAQLFSNAQ